MNQGQPTIGYDQFMPKSHQERISIFNDVSAENRALIAKTHVERWLAANRLRLSREQVAVIEEIIGFISPELYEEHRDFEKIVRQVEALREKAEAVLSPEDVIQILSDRLDYIPAA